MQLAAELASGALVSVDERRPQVRCLVNMMSGAMVAEPAAAVTACAAGGYLDEERFGHDGVVTATCGLSSPLDKEWLCVGDTISFNRVPELMDLCNRPCPMRCWFTTWNGTRLIA
jgi:hypothetical protein